MEPYVLQAFFHYKSVYLAYNHLYNHMAMGFQSENFALIVLLASICLYSCHNNISNKSGLQYTTTTEERFQNFELLERLFLQEKYDSTLLLASSDYCNNKTTKLYYCTALSFQGKQRELCCFPDLFIEEKSTNLDGNDVSIEEEVALFSGSNNQDALIFLNIDTISDEAFWYYYKTNRHRLTTTFKMITLEKKQQYLPAFLEYSYIMVQDSTDALALIDTLDFHFNKKPYWLDLHRYYAKAYFVLGKLEKAEKHLLTHLEESPRNMYEDFNTLLTYYASNGNATKAFSYKDSLDKYYPVNEAEKIIELYIQN